MPFRLKIFVGKFSLSFFLSLAILQFGLLSHVSSLRLSSGHSGLVLTLSMQPSSVLLTGGRRECLGFLRWELWLRHIFCGLWFLFLFSLPVMLPSEISKLPTDLLVRGFPGVWKLLLLLDSLARMGLHP